MNNNILLMTDYYKHTHHLMYPPGTEYVHSYIEARKSPDVQTLFFGLQGFLKKYLYNKELFFSCLADAQELCRIGFGFDYINWDDCQTLLEIELPIKICALPEGSIVSCGTPLVTIENTDPKFFWLPQFLETMLLRAIWYPTTVASISMEAKRIIAEYCKVTGCEISPYHLLDFGARGASSHETAAIGGAAHLLNFQGTDNIEGVKYLMDYYDAPVSGFSVMASEHSVTMAYGKKNEAAAYKRFFEVCPPEAAISIVIDTYDDINALRNIFGAELKETILNRPGATVFRPDSGEIDIKPIVVATELADIFGYEEHSSGYDRLNPKIKVLQGDGISDLSALEKVCKAVVADKLCMSNFMFGMGGGLLQNCTRDTYGFAMKASEVTINGEAIPIRKEPKSDSGKTSKAGRFHDPRLETVFLNGELLRNQSLDDIKKQMEK